MKLIIEEAENGFIVEEDPEIIVGGVRTIGRKRVFGELSTMLSFVEEFYTKKGKERPRKKAEQP